MKKYILAAALVLASTSAMADRTVSGDNSTAWYPTTAEACTQAKKNAASKASRDEQVESYGACDCSKTENGNYLCNVDARLEKKH